MGLWPFSSPQTGLARLLRWFTMMWPLLFGAMGEKRKCHVDSKGGWTALKRAQQALTWEVLVLLEYPYTSLTAKHFIESSCLLCAADRVENSLQIIASYLPPPSWRWCWAVSDPSRSCSSLDLYFTSLNRSLRLSAAHELVICISEGSFHLKSSL